MRIPSRIPPKLKPRVDFKPEEFRKHILTSGLRVLWEQASECPCKRQGAGDLVTTTSSMVDILVSSGTSSQTGEAKAECPTCHGNGYFYHSSQQIWAIVTRVGADPKGFPGWGEWTKGISFVTTLPEHVPAYQDRFTMMDSVLIYRETRRRGAGPRDALRYPIVERTLDTDPEATPYPFTLSVLYCTKIDSVTGEAKELVKDIDFSVTSSQVDWSEGRDPPAEGDFYAISYYANPRYVVLDIPHAFRDTWIGTKVPEPSFAPMPINSLCQMEFLNTREDPEAT